MLAWGQFDWATEFVLLSARLTYILGLQHFPIHTPASSGLKIAGLTTRPARQFFNKTAGCQAQQQHNGNQAQKLLLCCCSKLLAPRLNNSTMTARLKKCYSCFENSRTNFENENILKNIWFWKRKHFLNFWFFFENRNIFWNFKQYLKNMNIFKKETFLKNKKRKIKKKPKKTGKKKQLGKEKNGP